MRRGAAVLLLAVLLLAPRGAAGVRTGPPADPPDESPRDAFDDSITVALETIQVRVIDNAGRPILGLGPEDFRVMAGGREVPVVALDWISSETPSPAPPPVELQPEGEAPQLPVLPATQGKLVVFFVQADLHPTRISGQMRLRPYTRELLATLHPSDRIAVVSFDSHLKLWLDFTDDREAVHAAIDRAMIFTPQDEIAPAGPPSLAARFDLDKARRAASPERAMELVAEALTDLPGEKTMLYLGWSWGADQFGHTRPGARQALRALVGARVTVFTLDVTSADEHDLESGLQGIAASTGGTYVRTFRQPGVATDKIAGAISGWYELTFDRAVLEDLQRGRVEIELRDRRGEVLARPVTLSSSAWSASSTKP
jgi:VWFA-related protein